MQELNVSITGHDVSSASHQYAVIAVSYMQKVYAGLWKAEVIATLQYLQAFGSIQSCAVLRDHVGRSKQVGFVQFTNAEEVESCIQAMHGKVSSLPSDRNVCEETL